jgi:hypothetical protein
MSRSISPIETASNAAAAASESPVQMRRHDLGVIETFGDNAGGPVSGTLGGGPPLAVACFDLVHPCDIPAPRRSAARRR